MRKDTSRSARAWRYIFAHGYLLLLMPAFARSQSVGVWEVRRAAEEGKSPFIACIIEYRPAPGQFINTSLGSLEAAERLKGGLGGLVSLGGFGGYIIAGFDHTVWNDPDNPYGVDFTVVGNATENSSEPGIVAVMADTNGNGLPDETWYELKAGSYDSASTVRNYVITYTNPKTDAATDVPWRDNLGNNGVVKEMSDYRHTQPHYPAGAGFPGYPQDEVSFTGTLVHLNVDDKDPQYIRIRPLPFGYADNLPYSGWERPPFLPDDPKTFDVQEGFGGNAFDIDWAVDENGNPVYLEGVDFIKIYTAVNVSSGWLGEISTEVRGVIDVSPADVTSAPAPADNRSIKVYPNPASDCITIQSDGNPIGRTEIWNAAGKLMYIRSNAETDLLTISVQDYPAGIYLILTFEEKRRMVRKVTVQ